jgi:hypothetical protein
MMKGASHFFKKYIHSKEEVKMKKLKLAAVAFCLMALAASAFAKDKEYEDGTLTNIVASGKGWENNLTGNGRHRVYYYDFSVQLGDKTYVGRYSSKKNNLLKKGEWSTGGPVQVRFEKKNALIAHATYMFVKYPDKNKEIRTTTDLGWGGEKKPDDSDSDR